MRQSRFVSSILVVLFAAACGPSTDTEPRGEGALGQTSEPIWNGVDYQPTPPTTGGVVYILAGTGQNSTTYEGSGVALTNNWVLTARHVRRDYDAANVRVYLTGNTAVGYKPDAAYTINVVKWQPLGAEPIYDMELLRFDTPLPINGSSTTPYKTQIFQGSPGSTSITQQIIDLHSVECWGWGLGGSSGTSGTPRRATLPVQGGSHQVKLPNDATTYTFLPPRNFFTTPSTTDQQVAQGDSGGPCYKLPEYSLVGIIRDIEVHPTNPSPLGVMTSVAAYNDPAGANLNHQLKDIVDTNPHVPLFADADGDANPDLFMVVNDNGIFHLQMRMTGVPLLAASNGFFDFSDPTFGLLNQVLPASAIESALATMGDYNGDGVNDILTLYEGHAFYYDGISGSLPVIHFDQSSECWSNPFTCLDFVFPVGTFAELRTVDLNFDGFDDVEMMGDENGTQVYYGSPHGLTGARIMSGFPTSDGGDGKFATVNGQGNATIGHETIGFWIDFDPANPTVAIEVFDGETEGYNDQGWLGDDNTCFSLYRAPDNQVQPGPIGYWDKSDFADSDNAWKTIFKEPPDAMGEWVHTYKLLVKLGTGSCVMNQGQWVPSGPADPNAVNAFKVRTTYYPEAEYYEGLYLEGSDPTWLWSGGQASIVGRDAAGPAAVSSGTSNPVPDTSYDGEFSFYILPTDNVSGLTIREADADFQLDGEKGPCPGWDDPIVDDPAIPGVAAGANDSIQYAIDRYWEYDTVQHNFEWETVFTICDPSGNWDGATDEIEERHFTMPAGYAPVWRWRWSNVYAQNNILLEPVTASPAGYAMAGAEHFRPRAPRGSGRPIDYWLENLAETQTMLPVTLGESDASIQVDTVADAVGILDQAPSQGAGNGHGHKVSICHYPPGNPKHVRLITVGESAIPGHLAHGDDIARPQLSSELLSELLAAKLGVERAAMRGQNLLDAFLYGREETVAQVIEEADAILPRADAVCAVSDADLERMEELVLLLRAINEGSITFIPRGQAKGPTSSLKQSRKPRLVSMMPNNWGL